MSKILFVPSVGRGIIQFKLILEELNKGGNFTVTTIAIDNGRALSLQKEGFHTRDIEEYQTRNMLKIIQKESPDILITDFGAPPTINLIHAAYRTGLPSLMIDCGIKADSLPIARIQNKRLFSKFVVWLRSGQKFQSLPFDLATLWAINKPWRFPVEVAKVMMGFFQGLPSYVEGLEIAILSSVAKEWYVKDGIPPEHLFVIGQPRFDLIQKQQFDTPRLRRELGVPEDKGIIVLATQAMVENYLWTSKELKKFIEVVIKSMINFPEKQLVIKLHPGDNIDIHRRILSAIGDDKSIICRDIDTYELLHACDLLITYYSTVALEAMLFDKPVITVNLFGKTDIFPYAQSGAALGVYREAELVPAIRKALYDTSVREELSRKSREFAYEHIYKPDGRASQRGAELILELVKAAATRRNNV
jgi:glycosyltransferase involved in cell wall biosynthesis